MNFVQVVENGQRGKNMGLSTGMIPLDKALNRIQKKAIYAVAAGPKVGKTTFVDYAFVIQPYLYYMKHMLAHPESKLKIRWIYFSFEIDRVKKELKYAAYYFAHDYGVYDFMYRGRYFKMSPSYLEGKMLDETDLDEAGEPRVIKISPEHMEMLKKIYVQRIIPMFGKYDENGTKVQEGMIDFIEEKDNPTGLRNYLLAYAKQNGQFLEVPYKTTDEKSGREVTKNRIIGYSEKNSELMTIVVTDHMRKPKRERGYTLKENIDKWVEYQVELRNWCKFTFVDIIHLNRSLSNIERTKILGEFLYPTGDDIKDTGNLSEEADYILTMFNPQDEKYGIKKHFGIELDSYPNYRSIHLVESRDTECPNHLRTSMYGNVNMFQPI